MYRVIETTCKTALHRHNSKWLPYKYDINVYRGCAHGCIYCYAPYSHEYIGAGSFYDEVYAKTNIADALKRELPRFKRETVNIGGVTDSYQPAERKYKLMPAVLSLLAQYGIPTIICTKSALILRDIEQLYSVSNAGGLSAAFTITTLDENIASLIEPKASSARARIAAVRSLRDEGISCGVHLMPVIPFLTSGGHSLEEVFCAARDAGANYVLTGGLNLKTSTRRGFFEKMSRYFPSEYRLVNKLYSDKDAYNEYNARLNRTIKNLREKYSMLVYAMPKDRPAHVQLKFF
ncbi:MAG: radical SAM protein [Christensenellales bacterium]